MSEYHYIYWPKKEENEKKDAKVYCHVHLLIGYNQGTIQDFMDMTKILRKTFPNAKYSDVRGSKASRSSYVDGFTIITYGVELFRKDMKSYEKAGWSNHVGVDRLEYLY
jgi:hypothetical protein